MGIIGNFVNLVIVAQFDEFVYISMSNEKYKKLLEEEFVEEVFQIRHTTSNFCGVSEIAPESENDKHERKMRVLFKDRACSNKCMYIAYRVMRCIFVTFYFYLLPWAILMTGLL